MRRLAYVVLAAALAFVGLAGLAGPPAANALQTVPHTALVSNNPANFTPHALDGEVWAIAQSGQWIVMGGSFTQVQAASGGPVLTRNSIFAFNKDTGAISTTFAPSMPGGVKSIATGPNGTVYVGGSFNAVGAVTAYKVTQLNVSNGAVVSSFKPPIVNAIVQDVQYRAGRLFIGGSFTAIGGVQRLRLAELNATTGALLPFNVPVEGTHFGGSTQIYHMDVNPNATKMVLGGNFMTVGGQPRVELAMIDLTTNAVSSWQTNRMEPRCYDVFKFILRDVEFSPDGEYFVVGTTGGFGSGSPQLCDTITRWESDASGPNQNPTWINYTGGDSNYSVGVTGSVIYIGGHERWVNSPSRGDAEGPGAVPRQGIAALDPDNGLPYSWDSGRTRGQGVFDFLATAEGLFFGSDTDQVHGEYHAKIAFFPLAGGSAIPKPTPPNLPVDIHALGDTSSATTNVLYRINAGGATAAAVDNGPDWAGDNSDPSPYRNSGSNSAGWGAVGSIDATVPATTSPEIFSSERWDPGDGNPMRWTFPVPSGKNITVRLFLANQCDCTETAGLRKFDVAIDGVTRLDDYDIVADVGDQVGTMKAYNIVSDGIVNIDFDHVVENPLVNGIEIIDRDAPPSPPGDGITVRSYDGTSVGAGSALNTGGIDWSQATGAFLAGNTLYTAWSDGHFYKRTFNGTTFGAPQDINLYGLSQFSNEMRSMTGLFYENGRIYYTLAGSSNLHMRYFTVESDVVGAGLRDLAPFQVAGNLPDVNWSTVRGMALIDGKLYWANRTTGNLHRLDWSDGQPVAGTGAVVSGPGTDGVRWSQRSLFARQTAANQAPVAGFQYNCDELSCSFTDTSSDSDGSIVSRSWDFGDGEGSTQTNPDHDYDLADTYTVRLTVTDNRGSSRTAEQEVTVAATPNAPPTANFTQSCNALTCNFTDTSTDSDGTIVQRSWNFGDGGSSTLTNPSHTFPAAGTYNVTLVVTDNDTATGSMTKQVTVSAAPANAVAYRASATDTQAGSATNHRVVVPASVQASDSLLLYFSSNAPNVSVSTPAGWTQVGTRSTSGMLTRIWSRSATAGDAGSTITVTTGAAARAILGVSAYDNGAQVAVADVTTAAETVTRAAHTTPATTVSGSGAWVVSLWSDKTAATTTWAAPGGQSVRTNLAETGAGHTSVLLTDGNAPVSSGARPGLTATADSSSLQATMATIVVRPAP